MRVLDLFAGIGGFTLGLERAGFETVAFCEIEPYAQKVLAKNWPGVPIYDDVRTITADRLLADGIGVDVITGGFPCQDISVAGKQAGIEGERSGLWTECARLIRELQPRYAIFENVTNLLTGDGGDWFKRVLWDISEVGYDAEWHCIPASAIGAHHHRDRVWIVAYSSSAGSEARSSNGLGDDDRSCGNARQLAGASEQESVLAYPRHNESRRESKRSCNQLINSAETGERPEARDGFADSGEVLADTDSAQRQRRSLSVGIQSQHANIVGASGWSAEPDVGRVANGVPARSHRLKCLGNAVVPPIPELIGRAIMQNEGANEQ